MRQRFPVNISALNSFKSVKFAPLKDQSIELGPNEECEPERSAHESPQIKSYRKQRCPTSRRNIILILIAIVLLTVFGIRTFHEDRPEQPVIQSHDLHRDPSEWPIPSLQPEYIEHLPLTSKHRYNLMTIIAPDRYPSRAFTFNKVNSTNYKGPSSLLMKGGVISNKERNTTLLCNIGIDKSCRSFEIAEYASTVYAFCPIYSTNQSHFPIMYKHHQNFVAYMRSFGLRAVELEAIYPEQKFKLTTAGNEPWQFQLEINDTFYYRENFLNVLARKVKGWEYMLWIDAHQTFGNPYFWEEAIRKMEIHGTVQLAQTIIPKNGANISLADDNNSSLKLPGALYGYTTTRDLDKYIDWKKLFLGNCMGVRKEVYDKIGTIIDTCIGGHCDTAYDYATMTDYWMKLHDTGYYYNQLEPWILNARKYMNNSGVIRGNMSHLEHEHNFKWFDYLSHLKSSKYNLTEQLYRDENFTLRIKNDTAMLKVFPRYNTSGALVGVPAVLMAIYVLFSL